MKVAATALASVLAFSSTAFAQAVLGGPIDSRIEFKLLVGDWRSHGLLNRLPLEQLALALPGQGGDHHEDPSEAECVHGAGA